MLTENAEVKLGKSGLELLEIASRLAGEKKKLVKPVNDLEKWDRS